MTELKSVYKDKPYIKLEIHVKGNYTWEIKVIGDSKEDVEKLAALDKMLHEKYGTQEI